MGKINLLDSAVYNRIAAGEVVERPASIVKELVENSIDAGATAVSIDIHKGGIELIRIADNGGGIYPEDVPLAFMPHATSKIKNMDDLDNIGTLGFRGEALASIAAVARVTLVSRPPDRALGYGMDIENGKLLEEGARGCPFGTTITVKDVFGNIPARKKFLSKPFVEQAEISDIITRFIVANPNVAFKYSTDGKLIFNSDGRGVESAIYTVYGNDFCDNTCSISVRASGIAIDGYISKPYYTKHNRNYQTLIVNGRYVINQDISYCMYGCYANFLMKRQYPAYVLYLHLPTDMVDVNIHPNKLDVKFVDADAIKRMLIHGVREALSVVQTEPKPLRSIIEAETAAADATDTYDLIQKQSDTAPETKTALPHTKLIVKNNEYGARLREETNRSLWGRHISAVPVAQSQETLDSSVAKQTNDEVPVRRPNPIPPTEQLAVQVDAAEYKLIGCLFDTYIAVEFGNNLYLIDQHAAHERILYDKLCAQLEKESLSVQQLLVPYRFSLNPTDTALLAENAAAISAAGFDIRTDDSGPALYALPAIVAGMDMNGFVTILMQTLSSGQTKGNDFIKDALMQAACKAAVKGGEHLSERELIMLMQDIHQRKVPLYCPHGRPIAIKIEKRDLEKWFKRIL